MVGADKIGGGIDLQQGLRISIGIGSWIWRRASLEGVIETEKTAEPKAKGLSETIEVAGSQIIDQVKLLIKEGNVRQLKVRAKDSDFSLEMPVTVGVIVGGAVVLTAPWLAILGVVAALMTKVEIEVERDGPAVVPDPDKPEA